MIRQLLLSACLAGAAAPGRAQVTPGPAPQGVAQDPVLDRRTREVASGLRCPVCQGLSIADSPSELAQEMKGLVREQLAAGKSDQDVRDYFIAKYGEWVLLEPKAEGVNLLVYLLPVVLLGGGAVFIWRFVRRHTFREEEHPV